MSKIQKTVSGGILTVAFPHGKQVTVNVAELSPEIQRELMEHGLKQKVGDSYAGALTSEDAYAKAVEVADALKAGQWNPGRTGASGDIVEALAMETGKPLAECADVIARMDKDRRKQLKENARIKMHLATIQARRMAERAETATGPDLMELIG